MRADIMAAMGRVEQLVEQGKWVRLSVSAVATRVAPAVYVDLEWGDVDGGIEQKSICTEYFEVNGRSWKNYSL